MLLLLANRLTVPFDQVADTQLRMDIITVIACGGVLLNALSEQDITTRERDKVSLVGFYLKDVAFDGTVIAQQSQKQAIEWAVDTLVRSTPTKSVCIIHKSSKIVAKAGIVASKEMETVSPETSPILRSSAISFEEVYLPDVQILPGKIEFTYLPLNIQALIIVSIKNYSIVVGTNQAKSFQVKDIQRIRSIAAALDKVLN